MGTFYSNLEAAACSGELLDGCLGSNLVDSGACVLTGSVAVHFHELGKIELRLLEDFDLSDEHVL